jgi:hypothetical protein
MRLIFILLAGAFAGTATYGAAAPDKPAWLVKCAEGAERYWRGVSRDPVSGGTSSRDLFTYALLLCEAGKNPERLERLFDLGAQMQDRDERSRGYGNFRWNWAATNVLDYNAVDFCLQGGALLWVKHQAAWPAAARERLQEILRHAVPGALKHKVNENYTNIALMNAANLILLGEALGQSETAAEGRRRLEAVLRYTLRYGTHEYDSPTYYGVDLDVLGTLEAYTKDATVRKQARAMLELFWMDIAANWLPGTHKLGGTRSRDYDYLRGLGILDMHLYLAGWIDEPPAPGMGYIYGLMTHWQPPKRIAEMAQSAAPRLVRSRWGPRAGEYRTHLVLPDISLSASGANYGTMDLPLTLDFPGPRTNTRGYFIPDGRHDPYGKAKIAERSGHFKTLHLTPFFTATQERRDALALAIYRERDIPTNSTTLESHFVLPLVPDGVVLNDRALVLEKSKPLNIPMGAGDLLILRQGTAAAGVRVPWSRDTAGQPAEVVFVWDTNQYGAVRLTVNHRWEPGRKPASLPGAAFWVRIGSNLKTGADFDAWKLAFGRAKVEATETAEGIRMRAEGADGSLTVAAEAPFTNSPALHPSPADVVLEINGRDVGKELLSSVVTIRP